MADVYREAEGWTEMTVVVPGSTSNLGSGYDVFGMALSVYLRLTARLNGTSGPNFTYKGDSPENVPLGADNLVWVAAVNTCKAHRADMPGLDIDVENEVPLGRGLGSSGSAIIAGVILANQFCRLGLNYNEMLSAALRTEPHPDNLTPSLTGSAVASCIGRDGLVMYTKIPVSPLVRAVVVVPEFQVSTAKARAVLPDTYTKEETVFNLQRAAMLPVALASNPPDPKLVSECMRDMLHQDRRACLVPGFEDCLELATQSAPGFLGISLSGAGPCILTLSDSSDPAVLGALGQRVVDIIHKHGNKATCKILEVEHAGARCTWS